MTLLNTHLITCVFITPNDRQPNWRSHLRMYLWCSGSHQSLLVRYTAISSLAAAATAAARCSSVTVRCDGVNTLRVAVHSRVSFILAGLANSLSNRRLAGQRIVEVIEPGERLKDRHQTAATGEQIQRWCVGSSRPAVTSLLSSQFSSYRSTSSSQVRSLLRFFWMYTVSQK